MPISAGASRWKAFNYGQASIVEPIFATIELH